jgi:N-methylhydantoinase A
VGVDTGGTFTDFVALRGREIVTLKLPSTPRAPERGVLAGLERLGAGPATRVVHGSTVATNTLLERRGARVALLTTAGFEDLLEIGRQERPQLYDLAPQRVEPLVPAARRIGVRERLGPRGEKLLPLTAAAIRQALARARRARPDTVAIGLLHAYAAPAHERALARAARRAGFEVSVSSELCPEIREFERLATTVTNAYLVPRVARHLEALARRCGPGLEIVLSHGGTAPPAEAAREPARQLLSGPAAGLAAAREVARASGFARALTLDVGGTSTDCAFVEGELPRRRAREVGGFPLLLPLLDVHTVGAGGGSIARVDAGGLLHVGPESAGAAPGPACYGRGGPPTVTDALVTLGRIAGESLAGGALALDRAAAERAMAKLARTLGARSAVEAAEGVVAVAEGHIEAALRKVSVERGHDPRDAPLVAFGGAGGLHACPVAEALGSGAVLFPARAGVLSALGALGVGARRERTRSVLLAASDAAAIARTLNALEREVRSGFPPAARRAVWIERRAEARYRGQSHELSLPAESGLAARFHREHKRHFGFADSGREVEVVTLEVRGWLEGERGLSVGARTARAAPAPARERIRVRHGGRWIAAAVLERDAMGAAGAVRGPAVVRESGATLWVPPGWSGTLDRAGTLVLRRGRGR